MATTMNLTRNNYDVKHAVWADRTDLRDGLLRINRAEIEKLVKPILDGVAQASFDLVAPGENTRIIHVLDTIQPMHKPEGNAYPGIIGPPTTTGSGATNLLRGFAVMESAPLPWESASTSSGLLYPRDAIVDMTGPISEYSPFSHTSNLVICYSLVEGKSSAEYDAAIRQSAMRVADYLARVAEGAQPDQVEHFSIDGAADDLPKVVLVWQCQNQGVYANTLLYAHPIDNLTPTWLHPNEMLDGAVVSGNYVWPAFKVPTYLHANHPILLDLYRRHGVDLNFRGVVFSRSHNPTHWHKERSASFCVKLAHMLGADGLVMAWEGGGNAAVDAMLTIQYAETSGIAASAITFEFGGKDGTEGDLLVDSVPEAIAIVSGGSIEKTTSLPAVDRVVGGDVLRLNKESGGWFPEATDAITFDTTTHIYCSGNQSGHGRLYGAAY
ncbi:MAG: glycine/sarcosine/betaine reductase component B subunit [Clostridia bacterium]|nr:glycine/sarcosine/betaine reductase component B subunit [Clostridia bacterium]